MIKNLSSGIRQTAKSKPNHLVKVNCSSLILQPTSLIQEQTTYSTPAEKQRSFYHLFTDQLLISGYTLVGSA